MSTCFMVLLLMEAAFLQQEYMHMIMLHFADNPSDHCWVEKSYVKLQYYEVVLNF